jgi:hypothetical protein
MSLDCLKMCSNSLFMVIRRDGPPSASTKGSPALSFTTQCTRSADRLATLCTNSPIWFWATSRAQSFFRRFVQESGKSRHTDLNA